MKKFMSKLAVAVLVGAVALAAVLVSGNVLAGLVAGGVALAPFADLINS